MKIPKFLMRDVATVAPYAGSTATGPSYGVAYEQRGRYEQKQRVVKDAKGIQVVSEGLFMTNQYIPKQSKVTVNQMASIALVVAPVKGLGPEPAYYEVYLG